MRSNTNSRVCIPKPYFMIQAATSKYFGIQGMEPYLHIACNKNYGQRSVRETIITVIKTIFKEIQPKKKVKVELTKKIRMIIMKSFIAMT